VETSWQSTDEENTYVLDSEGAAEMARLTEQHRVVTRYMGALINKSIQIPEAGTILDVACGPGGWVLDTAFEYPKSEVVGIDISDNLIQYAHAQARVQGLQQAARFQRMDATKQLDFPDASFDLVNARFLIGFLAPAAWPTFIQECMRITRPEGYIQLTECDDMGTTNSPAFEHLWTLCARAFQKAERSFSPEARNFNITPMLGHFIQQAGYQNIQTIPHVIDFSVGAEAHYDMVQDWKIGLELLQPFITKMGMATQQEAEHLYQLAIREMMSDGFRALWYFTTVIGQRPL